MLRDAPKRPHFHRARESVLNNVLREREVVDTENARQGCEQPAGFATEKMFVGYHQIYICRIGRTSTNPPPSKIGQPRASSVACARSLASISEYPPMMSLDSA